MSTAITVEPAAALARLIEEYHVDQTMGAQLSSTFLPYFEQAKVLLDQAAQVSVTDPTQVTEIKASSEIRRKLKAIRCEAEAKREEFKKPFLNACRAIDFAPKLLASQTEPEEKRLLDGEKIAERMEAERIDGIRNQRYTKLKPYLPASEMFDAAPLGHMTVSAWEALISGMEQQHAARETERLKAAAAARIAEAQRRVKEAAMAEENARLKKEQEAQDAAHAAQLAAERSAAAAVSRKEQEARQKAEAELAESVRAAQELQAQRDAMRAREEADAKAKAAAPDKEKLLAWANTVMACQRPREHFGSREAGDIAEQANVALVKLADWLKKKAGAM